MECGFCEKDVTPNSSGMLIDSEGNPFCLGDFRHFLPAFTVAYNQADFDAYYYQLRARLENVRETISETMTALDSETGLQSGRNPHVESFDEEFVVVEDEMPESEETDYPFPTWYSVQYSRVSTYKTDYYDDDSTSFAMQDLESCSKEDAEFVVVPVTGYSDYSGSGVERSNFRSLQRDFSDENGNNVWFVTSYGGYDSNELLLRMHREFANDEQRETYIQLLEICGNLAEQYPLYDEEDHSELETTEAWNSWDQWLRSDVINSLTDPDRAANDWKERMWDAVICPEAMEDMIDSIPADDFQQMFYDFYYENCNEYPYWENGSSGMYFPNMEESVVAFAEHLWEKRLEMFNKQIDGQEQLFHWTEAA